MQENMGGDQRQSDSAERGNIRPPQRPEESSRMSESKCIAGSRVELFISKSGFDDCILDYDFDTEEFPDGVDMPTHFAPVLQMVLSDSLEHVLGADGWCFCDLTEDGEQHLREDGEQVLFKAWFDFSTRKVLAVKCIKIETINLDLDTYELEDPIDPNAIANVQACFDMPENKDAFDTIELMLREGVAEALRRAGCAPRPQASYDVFFFELAVPEGVDFFITQGVRDSWKEWDDFWLGSLPKKETF
jgi:hypothetical protein